MVDTYAWTSEEPSWVVWPRMDRSFIDEEIDQPSFSSIGGGGRPIYPLFPVSNVGSWASEVPAGHHLHQAAEFGGGRTKEMEVGMSSSTNIMAMEDVAQNLHMTQRSQAEQRRLPLQSSPEEISPLLRNMTSATFSVNGHATKLGPNQPAIYRQQSTSVSSSSSGTGYGLTNAGVFPTSASDDEAMMRAMLVVLSSSTSPATDKGPPPRTGGNGSQVAAARRHRGTAFEPYIAGQSDRYLAPTKLNPCDRPSMVKVLHSILRSIRNIREAEATTSAQEAGPSCNQLHHMMSERKRREKLNDSFRALRSELSLGTRKDKASLLAAAKDQLINLKAQISDLERDNRELEMRLPPSATEEEDHGGTSIRRSVRVEMNAASGSSTSKKIGRIMATGECDISDLATGVLGRLKQMREAVALESMIAKYISSRPSERRACTLTLEFQIAKAMEDEWDENEFTKAITRAIEEEMTS